MPSHLLPVLARQGLGGVLPSLVQDVCVLGAVYGSSLSSPSLFGTQGTQSSSSSSMLLQNRHHVAATGAAAPAAADNGPVRRTPVKANASPSKKASKASSSPGSNRAAAGVPEHKVLKAVPGLGKVYWGRLQERGISSLDKLAENILAKLTRQDAQEAFSPGVKYLQELGIRQHHAKSIVKHITAKFDQNLYSKLQEFEVLDSKGPPLTLCVEGNISAGKSTFLQYITNNNEELKQQLGVVKEPVDDWQRVPAQHMGGQLNMLDTFYQDPHKHATSFQSLVLFSRVMQERQSAGIPQPVRLMERSVFSDRMVFVRAVNESKWMSDVELAVYDSMFVSHLTLTPTLVPDGFIYLRCTPDTCMDRLKMRARSEEVTIEMDYLEGLHQKHEDWLGAGHRFVDLFPQRQARRQPWRQSLTKPHVKLPGSGLLVPRDISPMLQDSLYVMDADRSAKEMHSKEMYNALNGMPALVLECDRDVLRDLDLQQEVQQTVTEYIKLMRQHREQREQRQREKQASSGASASNSGGSIVGQIGRRSGGRSSVHGEVQAAAVQLVQESAADADISVVHHSSGELRERLDQPSGNLEALLAADSSMKGGANGSSGKLLVNAVV